MWLISSCAKHESGHWGHTSEQGEEALLGGAQALVGGTGNLQVKHRNNADSVWLAATAQSPKLCPLSTLLPGEEDFSL